MLVLSCVCVILQANLNTCVTWCLSFPFVFLCMIMKNTFYNNLFGGFS